MKCKICGARINDGDKFCPRCGTVKKTTDAKVKKENLFFVFSCIFGIIGFIGGFVAIVDYSKIAMVKKKRMKSLENYNMIIITYINGFRGETMRYVENIIIVWSHVIEKLYQP